MDFEKEMSRLREIAEQMSNGELTLEQSMKLYTEAGELSQKLADYFENAKLKVEELEN